MKTHHAMGSKTMLITQEAHANTLAGNKDGSQIVIAGRNIFKIFSIEETEIVEKMNLRVGKNMNLNYSSGDVVWSHLDDNILATAATNGSVVTWRLDKPSVSKQDMVFQDHRRTVNKVNFHPTEAHLLISGSQDGTMKLFDLRRKEVIVTFYSNAESVRDVEFSHFHHHMFAAVQENGNVQLWDMRRIDRCERQFTAHSGPVFACDWHPEEKRWLATAGRDKIIKIWDMIALKPSVEFTIQTIAPVARVKWRPQRKFHVASCALVMDFSINVWDIRRPFIPFAAFNEHKDVTTGIMWKNDPHTFYSTSKDNTLYQHSFQDAVRPADRANPAGLDMNCSGDICLALSDKLLTENSIGKENYSSTRLPTFFRKVTTMGDQFRAACSALRIINIAENKHLSTSWFVKSAKEYHLTGRSITEICDHNATVAANLDLPQESATWNILKLMYSGTNASVGDIGRMATVESHRSSDLEKGFSTTDAYYSDAQMNDQRSGRHQSGSNHRHHSGGKGDDRLPGDTSTGLSEEETETDDTDHDWMLANIASGAAYNQSDMLFGEGQGFGQVELANCEQMEDPYFMKVLTLEDKMKMIDWQLPVEAFQPRHDFIDHSPPSEHIINIYQLESDDNEFNGRRKLTTDQSLNGDHDQISLLAVDPVPLSESSWDCTPIVVDMMHFYASQGNVQMSVSILIILGDRIRNYIDEQIQEEWYFIYIDLLARFKLYTVANEVIKLSPLPSINQLNQHSTTIYISCGCNKPLGHNDWVCERCKIRHNICSVCHQTVKGLYVWCQGCAHGGHLQHIQEWIESNPSCPAGCGHYCQYV